MFVDFSDEGVCFDVEDPDGVLLGDHLVVDDSFGEPGVGVLFVDEHVGEVIDDGEGRGNNVHFPEEDTVADSITEERGGDRFEMGLFPEESWFIEYNLQSPLVANIKHIPTLEHHIMNNLSISTNLHIHALKDTHLLVKSKEHNLVRQSHSQHLKQLVRIVLVPSDFAHFSEGYRLVEVDGEYELREWGCGAPVEDVRVAPDEEDGGDGEPEELVVVREVVGLVGEGMVGAVGLDLGRDGEQAGGERGGGEDFGGRRGGKGRERLRERKRRGGKRAVDVVVLEGGSRALEIGGMFHRKKYKRDQDIIK